MEQKETKYIIRIVNTDLDGKKAILIAMRKIKGISVMLANAFLTVAGIDKSKKAGDLTDSEVQKLNDAINNPVKFGIPSWMFDRRCDSETGEDKHIITGTLKFQQENDIKMMKKMKSYRGMRHAYGLPVRGQKTRSNFRRDKGKVSLGVQRKKAQGGAKKK